MTDKEYLAERLFHNLSLGSNIAGEIGDCRFQAILSTMAVLLYNNQQEQINELFEYFQKELFPKVKQPEQKEISNDI